MDNHSHNINLSTPLTHYISSSSDHLLHHHNQQHQQFWIINNNNNNSSRAEQPLSSNHSIYHHHSFNLNHHENDEETAAHGGGGDERLQRKENDNNNNEEEVEKEAMFEKPLTPSDVGKLNRLVIPKQHAEKYFPLGGNDSAADKGLLLSFEDESGKSWRFRYSYWNSSQSYVLTKGWSRYVKEKRLDAGDVVLFERHRSDVDRLFIGWRRRAPPTQDTGGGPAQIGGGVGRGFYNAPMTYPTHLHHHITGHYQNNNNNNNNNNIVSAAVVPYQTDCIHAGLISPGHQNQSTRIGNNTNNNNNNSKNNNSSKILRLFGVNMECHEHEQSEPSTPDGSSSLSSQDHQTLHHFYPHSYYSDHHRNHMDFTFSRDVKAMRDRRG